MNMRIAGHDVSIIALWLGHQDVSSTMKYVHADLKLKERALDRTAATDQQLGRYQPSDTVLNFLDNLATQDANSHRPAHYANLEQPPHLPGTAITG
jgi:hypothetical protein